MSRVRSPRIVWMIGAFATTPGFAAACAYCALEETHAVFPPVVPWSLIGVALFAAVVTLGIGGPSRRWPAPLRPTLAPFFFFGGLIAATQLGPLPLLAMLAIAAWGLVDLLGHPAGRSLEHVWFERALAFFTVVALIASAVKWYSMPALRAL